VTDRRAARLALIFSSIGHVYAHMFMLLFPTVVLALEKQWQLPYGELMLLLLPASILFGAGALPAGWLGDRWSAPKMMVIYFLGTGGAAVLSGLVSTTVGLAVAMGLMGLFASIYHPVGIAWLVRDAENRGRALGISGFFGAVGVALAPFLAGFLTDTISWRAAFIVPGLTCIAVGVVLAALVSQGAVRDLVKGIAAAPEAPRGEMRQGAIVLIITVIVSGLIYQAASNNLPKLFDQRLGGTLDGIMGDGVVAVSALVSGIFLFSSLAQLAGGCLADRFRLRTVYIVCWAVQLPLLLLVAELSSLWIWPAMFLVFAATSASLPAENSLFARYSPPQWRGTAFGIKFVLALGVSAAAIPLASYIHLTTGGFYWLFVILAVLAGIAAIATWFLPRPKADKDALLVSELSAKSSLG
jgi:MFS family permease